MTPGKLWCVLLPLLASLTACSEGALAAALAALPQAARLAGAKPPKAAPGLSQGDQATPAPALDSEAPPELAPEAGPAPQPGGLPGLAGALGAGVAGAVGVAAQPWPSGDSQGQVQVGGEALALYLHKPSSYHGQRMLVVFHGVNRDAEAYRDRATELGERTGALVVAPLFDEARFPYERYQAGGILRGSEPVPADQRTGALVKQLVAEVARREGHPGMAYALIGHSGGAQSLGRLAAFVPNQAQRIVLANPGSYTFPTEAASFPYGLGGLPASLRSDAVVKAYLAQPLAIFLGNRDVEADENLDQSAAGMAQGPHRYARGQAAFAAGQALARAKGWPFGWRLVVAEGVKHSSSGMFNHPRCAEALGW